MNFELRSVYISVSFGQDSRLDYQEYYGRQPEIKYRVNTKVGPLSLLCGPLILPVVFMSFFLSPFCKKGFLLKMMSPGQCDLTSNVGF